MKIAISAFMLDQGRSGISTYVRGLVEGLSKIDFRDEYDLLIPRNCTSLFPHLNANFRLRSSASWLASALPNIGWHNTLLPMMTAWRGYNVLHIPSLRRIPLIKGCPVVATVHDMAPFVLDKKYDFLRTFYHRQILSRLILRSNHLITVSEQTKNDILRFTSYPEERISVIYPGIDVRDFRQGEREVSLKELRRQFNLTTPFIVYVSRIEHPGKNHLRLIQAFEKFKDAYKTSHQLVLAGADWPGASVVKEYAGRSSYRDSIRFLGYVSRESIVNLYRGSDLVIFPSLYEGFGFPLIEAMACGARTACSNTSSLLELGTGYAELFDPRDVESICQAILSALGASSPPERSAEYARRFSWESAAKATLEVYERFK